MTLNIATVVKFSSILTDNTSGTFSNTGVGSKILITSTVKSVVSSKSVLSMAVTVSEYELNYC